jgi:hypothetical protein
MGLFGNKEAKAAKKAVSQGACDRLLALTPAARAVEVLPVLDSLTRKRVGKLTDPRSRATARNLCRFPVDTVCKGLGDFSQTTLFLLRQPIKDSLQLLEHANLVAMTPQSEGGTLWSITEAGEQALADGTAAQKLGLAGVDLETILASVGQPAAVRLRQLDDLRYQRLVSDADFEAAKAKILGTSGTS